MKSTADYSKSKIKKGQSKDLNDFYGGKPIEGRHVIEVLKVGLGEFPTLHETIET